MSSDPKKQLSKGLPQAGGTAPAFDYAKQSFQGLKPKQTPTTPMQSTVPMQSSVPTQPKQIQPQVNTPVSPVVQTTGVTIPTHNFKPDYDQGIFSPEAKKIFDTPEYKEELQQRISKPIEYGRFGMDNEKIAVLMNYRQQKAMIGAIDDILVNKMPTTELTNLYDDLTPKQLQDVEGFTTDYQNAVATGIPEEVNKVMKLYIDLPQYVQKYVVDQYGAESPLTIGVKKGRQTIKDNSGEPGDIDPFGYVLRLGERAVENTVGGFIKAFSDIFDGIDTIGGNITGAPVPTYTTDEGVQKEKSMTQGVNQAAMGIVSAYFYGKYPEGMLKLNTAMEVPVVGDVIKGAMDMGVKVTSYINKYTPGLKQFRDTLTPQEQQEMDGTVAAIVMAGLLKKTPDIRSRNLNSFQGRIQTEIGNILEPINNIAKDFVKSDTVVAQPTPGSYSARFNMFIDFAKQQGYDVKPSYEAYQNFRTMFKGKDIPSYTGPAPEGTPGIGGAAEPTKTATTEGSIDMPFDVVIPKDISIKIQKSIKPTVVEKKGGSALNNFEKDVAVGITTVLDYGDKIVYPDELGEMTVNKEPSTLRELGLGLDQAETLIVQKYTDLAQQAGQTVQVETNSAITELEALKTKLSAMPGQQQIISYIDTQIADLINKPLLDVMTAQEYIKMQNAALSAFYKNPNYSDVGRTLVDALITNKIRDNMRATVESATGSPEYGVLRDKLRSILNIKKEVYKRAIVSERQNMKGIADFTDFLTADQVIRGIIDLAYGNVAGAAGNIGGALAMNTIKGRWKNLNSPNKQLRDLVKLIKKNRKNIFIPKKGGNDPTSATTSTPSGVNPTTPKAPTGQTQGKGGSVTEGDIVSEKAPEGAQKLETAQAQKATENKAKLADAKAKFEEVKKIGKEIIDGNAWKKGDVSVLGTLESGIIMDGRIRKVKIDGKMVTELEAKPVYRVEGGVKKIESETPKTGPTLDDFTKDMESTAPKGLESKVKTDNFGVSRTTALKAILDKYGINSLDDLPNNIAEKVVEAARSRSTRMEAEIDTLLSTYKKGLKSKEIIKNPEGQTLYHGGLSKIDTFDIGFAKTANYGKGIYFSDNPTMAKYYSMIKKDSEILSKGFDPKTGEYPKRGLGEVTNIKLSPDAKIKQLSDNPTIEEIDLAKTEGYDGVKFKDTIKKEDWNTELLGEEPKTANTTMIFNEKVIKVETKPMVAEGLVPKGGKEHVFPEEKIHVDRVTKQSQELQPKSDEVIVYRTGDSDRIDTNLDRAISRGMNKTSKAFVVKKSELIEQSDSKTKVGEYKLKPKGLAEKSTVDPLIAEARKYKSAEEFIKAQTKKEYRSAHQLNISDSITADQIDIPKLKEAIRARNGYLNNYVLSDLKKLEKLQGNPEGTITIYRASPKNELNPGDWITTDKTYANYIKQQNGGKVFSYDVKIKDLRFPNDVESLPSLQMATTFNYGPDINKFKQIREEANKKGLKPKK